MYTHTFLHIHVCMHSIPAYSCMYAYLKKWKEKVRLKLGLYSPRFFFEKSRSNVWEEYWLTKDCNGEFMNPLHWNKESDVKNTWDLWRFLSLWNFLRFSGLEKQSCDRRIVFVFSLDWNRLAAMRSCNATEKSVQHLRPSTPNNQKSQHGWYKCSKLKCLKMCVYCLIFRRNRFLQTQYTYLWCLKSTYGSLSPCVLSILLSFPWSSRKKGFISTVLWKGCVVNRPFDAQKVPYSNISRTTNCTRSPLARQ